MVRALLDGSKTQTRRVWKLPRGCEWYSEMGGEQAGWFVDVDPGAPWWLHVSECRCPYGQPGDQLWVRENGWERPVRTPKMMREGADTWARYYYDADGLHWQEVEDFKTWGFKRRPSIHMPRWASRIQLEITDVRVERLQAISEADARAEGARCIDEPTGREVLFPDASRAGSWRLGYRVLWESINGPGAWDANPWVWAISFRRIKP